MGYDAVPTGDNYSDHPKMPSDHHVLVLTQMKNKQKKRCGFFSKKSLWLCCSNVEVGAGAHEEEEEEEEEKLDLNLNTIDKKKKMMKKKKKKKVFLCCSNVEFETEGEREKVLSYLEKNTKKYSLMMCCSNIEVGPKTDLGHQTSK